MKQGLRPTILRFDALPSTNTEAAGQAVRGAPEGLCVVAREQTSGRGRAGRAWISPPDAGLYFSIVLRPARLAQRAWPLITLMAALAASDALKESSGLETDIKWPNDIIVNDLKLCGILAETVETAGGRAVVVGVGINLDERAFPPELKGIATSVTSVTGQAPDAERLLQTLIRAINRHYEILQGADGEEETLREWSRRSSFARGRLVRVSVGEESFEGRTCGLEPDGALRVETDQGEIKVVRAGDVTSLRAAGNK